MRTSIFDSIESEMFKREKQLQEQTDLFHQVSPVKDDQSDNVVVKQEDDEEDSQDISNKTVIKVNDDASGDKSAQDAQDQSLQDVKGFDAESKDDETNALRIQTEIKPVIKDMPTIPPAKF